MEIEILSVAIASYIKNRELAKLEKFDKEAEKKRKNILDPLELSAFELETRDKRKELEDSFTPANWLTNAAKRAKQISLVTHALKFTHTDAKGSSIYASYNTPDNLSKNIYLTSSSLQSPELDSVGNAAALDVANLLLLKQGGESLIVYISREDNTPFQPFATSEKQLEQWMSGFKQVLANKELSSDTLAKQLFFPISPTEYHLLSPLFASSLAHAIYQRVNDARYTEAAKAARKARREEKYSTTPTIDYPNIVVQNFGGAQPQNVSQLNASRGGKSYLLSCAPPSWQHVSLISLKASSLFHNYQYNKQTQIHSQILDQCYMILK